MNILNAWLILSLDTALHDKDGFIRVCMALFDYAWPIWLHMARVGYVLLIWFNMATFG